MLAAIMIICLDYHYLHVHNFPKEGKSGVLQIHVNIEEWTITIKYEIEKYGHINSIPPHITTPARTKFTCTVVILKNDLFFI